jgi:RNA polymerase sigma-70 factor (ECF subfamily)
LLERITWEEHSIFFSKQHQQSRQTFETETLSHLDALYGTALRLTGQVAEAEDLIQDTFVRAVRFRKRFEPGTNLKAWLFKMMVNLFINKYRRDKRSREVAEGFERRPRPGGVLLREALLR